MKIGVPKEIKIHEYRVGMTPSSVRELTSHGHTVFVEKQAGTAISFTDEAYIKAGAQILPSAKDVFAESDMIVKVKEPQESEWKMLRPDQTLFTFLHLAPDPDQARGLMESGCTAIAYETVTDNFGGLPLLAPMSEVAGRMSIQAGANFLEKTKGGRGVLLGGVAGVEPAKVTILGGGVVGANAAKMAVGLGAKVAIFDKSPRRLNELDWLFDGRVQTIYSTKDTIEEYVTQADLVVGAVLVTGAAAPKLVSREMLMHMKKGAVLVDVAIDQGGCFESSRPTTHTDPVYIEDGIIHYCVTNMPGAVARTSTLALNNATLPFIGALAQKGALQAMRDDLHLRNGLNVYQGQITHPVVARDLGLEFLDPQRAVA